MKRERVLKRLLAISLILLVFATFGDFYLIGKLNLQSYFLRNFLEIGLFNLGVITFYCLTKE